MCVPGAQVGARAKLLCCLSPECPLVPRLRLRFGLRRSRGCCRAHK